MRFHDERSKEPKETERDLVDRDALFLPLADQPAHAGDDEIDDDDDTASLPQITSMPDGITVIEQQIGHAIGQWVFVMVCDCGRRWFSLHAQDTAQCPRCSRWVRIEADPPIPG